MLSLYTKNATQPLNNLPEYHKHQDSCKLDRVQKQVDLAKYHPPEAIHDTAIAVTSFPVGDTANILAATSSHSRIVVPKSVVAAPFGQIIIKQMYNKTDGRPGSATFRVSDLITKLCCSSSVSTAHNHAATVLYAGVHDAASVAFGKFID